MIVRVFTAHVRADAVEAYERLLREVVIPALTGQDGLVALHVGRPEAASPREFVAVSVWRDEAAVRAFTGPDRGAVVLGDEAELVESTTVRQYESMLEWAAADGPIDPAGRRLPLTPPDLAARVEEGWAVTRDAIARLAEAGLDRSTAAGWTYRALALHLAAWHEQTIRRLGYWQATGERPAPVDIDAFNAEVAAEAATLRDDEVLARLDASHEAFLAAVLALPAERLGELDWWPVGVVAGNSYGHYAEHAEELGAG